MEVESLDWLLLVEKKKKKRADFATATSQLTQFLGGQGLAAGRGSSLARLHVGRDGTASRQALKALVGVVDEDPVLVLQFRLAVVGHWRCGGVKRGTGGGISHYTVRS